MPVPYTSSRPTDGPFGSSSTSDVEGFADLIGPMLAGAQARGVADAFELLGIGVALIDATGRVLHMGGRGRRVSAGWLRIAEDHLIADRSEDNAALQDLIGDAIDGSSSELVSVRLAASQGRAPLMIRALRFPKSTGIDQLLRAVLVFEELPTA